MSFDTENRPHQDESTQDLLNLAEQCGDLEPSQPPTHEQIAKLAHRLWELRKDKPSQSRLTDKDDWRRAEAILSGEANMGQLQEEHDAAESV